VHQLGALHPHLAVDFLHLSLLFNGETATQKKHDQTNLRMVRSNMAEPLHGQLGMHETGKIPKLLPSCKAT